ncbi:MAG: hypothetical protein ACRDA3_06010 [Peptostreptococcaceae bacterium]
MNDNCELCERNVVNLTKHHLLPREEGGKEEHISYLCEDCHKQIHALYTNKELAIRLDTIDKLKNDEKITKYIKFIKKQSPSKITKIKKSRNVRKC